jgi:hypothetical protein
VTEKEAQMARFAAQAPLRMSFNAAAAVVVMVIVMLTGGDEKQASQTR